MPICPICGNDFEASSTRNTICSVQCRRRKLTMTNRAAKGITEEFVRECGFCGDRFTTWHPYKIYCSIDCNNRMQSKRQHERSKNDNRGGV